MIPFKEMQCKFKYGQVVYNHKHGYRGVVVDVDSACQLDQLLPPLTTETVAEGPWYWVLLDRSNQAAYAPEQELDEDRLGDPISHPLMPHFFKTYQNGQYTRPYDA